MEMEEWKGAFGAEGRGASDERYTLKLHSVLGQIFIFLPRVEVL